MLMSSAELAFNRNVFTSKSTSKWKITARKVKIGLAALVAVLAVSMWAASKNEAVVDYVKLTVLESWNAKLVEYGLTKPQVEVNVADPVFVNAVVDWALQRGKGVSNVSKPLLEKFVIIAFAESSKQNVDPLLTIAVMAIESQFNYMATSHAGAKGLMQIIPYWHKEKITVAEVYDPITNIKAGAQILNEYLEIENGNVNRALLRYNGALHIPGANYDSKVLSARRDLIRSIEKRFVDNFKKQYA